jgi:demethoxyubiquinone hydroxylase (CLK1/Coq7/Cat5 family)
MDRLPITDPAPDPSRGEGAQHDSEDRPAVLTVYYDGACPVCTREIGAYRRQRGASAVRWVDASRCDADALGPGLDRARALARLHVRRPDGALVDGAGAFAAIWRALPAWSALGRVAGLAPVRRVLDVGYDGFLRIRRLWRTAPSAPPAEPSPALPPVLVADLRSDHAGETGAVRIYRGVLAVSRDPALRSFALRHLATESRHLREIEAVLPPAQRSRLLPAWRAAGWVTGALPALFGARAVHATVEAVETFVDRHYAAQLARIDALDPARADARLQALRALLDACRLDEVGHRDEAAASLAREGRAAGPLLRLWTRTVGAGSVAAVALCRRL